MPDAVIVADATAQVHQILEREFGLSLHRRVVRSGERTTLSFERLGELDAGVLLVPAYPRPDSLERDRTNSSASRACRCGRRCRARPARS